MDIEAQIRDIISEREPYLYEVLHENRHIRSFRGPITDEKVWKPSDDTISVDTPRSPKTNRNIIDERSIYAIDKSYFGTQSQEMKKGRKNPKRFMPSDVEQKKEREYIQRHLREGQPANMSSKIMQHFFQAPKVPFLGYGMPRPDTTSASVRNCRGKPPGIVVISNHRSLCRVQSCLHHQGTNGEYCDILGPGSCSSCIEETNRFIAEEIQRRLFPKVILSQGCLVVPKLSRAIRRGYMKQIRKQHLKELCLPESNRNMLKREEPPLSDETFKSVRRKKALLPQIPGPQL